MRPAHRFANSRDRYRPRENFDVSDTAYFVYCNGIKDKSEFNNQLEFKVKLIPYIGNADWVETTLVELKYCLLAEKAPDAADDCSYCRYVTKSLTI